MGYGFHFMDLLLKVQCLGGREMHRFFFQHHFDTLSFVVTFIRQLYYCCYVSWKLRYQLLTNLVHSYIFDAISDFEGSVALKSLINPFSMFPFLMSSMYNIRCQHCYYTLHTTRLLGGILVPLHPYVRSETNTVLVHGSHRPWKVLEFESCLEKCLIFQSALKMGNFPWKVFENDFMVLENIGTRKSNQ